LPLTNSETSLGYSAYLSHQTKKVLPFVCLLTSISPAPDAARTRPLWNFSMGETSLRIRRGTFTVLERHKNQQAIICGTLLGSVIVFVPIQPNQETKMLQLLQQTLEKHPLTKPLFSNSLYNYRSEMEPTLNVVDGDFVTNFIELSKQVQLEISKDLIRDAKVSTNIPDFCEMLVQLIDGMNQKVK